MDFGTDSALAARYKSEHACANEAIKHGVLTIKDRIQGMKNKRLVLKMDMRELVDKGYTPSFLAALGIPWQDLQRRYGASSLLEMGFTWDQMRNSGIGASAACLLGMDNLHICADQLMELGPTIQDVASMRLPLRTLHDKGFTLEKLLALGLNASNMNLFGFNLKQWSEQYKCDWDRLGFLNN